MILNTKSSQNLLSFKLFNIFKKFILIIFIANLLIKQSFAIEIWNSELGIKKLQTSQFNNDFYQLVNFYQPQINPIYCGIATALIIKNAIYYSNIPSQKISEYQKPNGDIIPFNLYISQDDFFNEETDKIKHRDIIKFKKTKNNSNEYDPGLSLSDFQKIIKIHKIKSKINYIYNVNEDEIINFRKLLKKILSDKNKFLVANFDGKILGAKTNGHISPIVAYNQDSDEILILDVALHKNQWYWVNISDLLKAMNTKDGENYRGYAILYK